MDWGVEREVQRGRTDAAGEGAAQGFLKIATAEGQRRFGIGEEEASGELVLPAAEFAVPVGGELVVVVLAWAADGKRNGIGGIAKFRAGWDAGWGREQISAGVAAELRAFEIQEREGDGIDAGKIAVGLER